MLQAPIARDVQVQVAAGLQAGWAVTQDRARAGWAVTQEKAQAGWAVTQEKAQAGWAVAKERAHAGCVAAKERVDVAREGRALLDRGGRSVETAIRAKVAAREAAASDAALAASASKAIAALEDAVLQLRAGREPAGCPPDGVAGLQDFEQLAEAYDARAAAYKQLLNGLQALPPAPTMSAAEEDAARILEIKEGCQRAARRALEGCEAVKERRCRSPCSNRQAWC